MNQSLQNHQFVSLEKPPQTLFTKDSTQVFLFTQKRKTNTFDGMIGFGNDKTEKFTVNGTLNVVLKNMFNSFESIGVYWQRNPDKGQTFDMQTDIPYTFGSNVGLNINVNIFRQDSTFACRLLSSFAKAKTRYQRNFRVFCDSRFTLHERSRLQQKRGWTLLSIHLRERHSIVH